MRRAPQLGLIIASGMTIGTLFTLYVLPAVYMYLGAVHWPATAESGLAAGEQPG